MYKRRDTTKELTVFIHSHLKTLFQPTRLALVAMSFVYDAVTATCLAPGETRKHFLITFHIRLGCYKQARNNNL